MNNEQKLKTYAVFPLEYDPMVAAGPCPDDFLKMGLKWTVEDTLRMREMESQVEFVQATQVPLGRWVKEYEK